MTNQPKPEVTEPTCDICGKPARKCLGHTFSGPEVKGIEQFRNVERFQAYDIIDGDGVELTGVVRGSDYAALLAFAEEQHVEALTYRIRSYAAESKAEEQGKEIERLKKEKAEAGAMLARVSAASGKQQALKQRAEAAESKLKAMEQRCEALESLNSANQLLLTQKESSRVSKPYRVALQKIAAMEEVEQELRKIMWLSHGHSGLYGDDGEMQCGECSKYGCRDYKNSPLDEVRKAYHDACLERMGKALEKQKAEKAMEEVVVAVNWLMGCNGEFEKPDGAHPYWWRSEFAKRAGFVYDGTKYVLGRVG